MDAAAASTEQESLTNGRSTIQLEDYGATSRSRKRKEEDKVNILSDQDQVRSVWLNPTFNRSTEIHVGSS